jgi:hypothetical protein
MRFRILSYVTAILLLAGVVTALYLRRGSMAPAHVVQLTTIGAGEISPKLRVAYGKSVHLKGDAIGAGDVLFAPSVIELEGNGFEATNEFASYALKQSMSPALSDAIDRGCDAVWIKGRLQKAFGLELRPANSGGEKSFSDWPFVALIAAPDGRFDGIPFRCIDYYGDTKLLFSEHQPPDELRDRIATAFWSLVLRDPTAIVDYSDVMYHVGCGKEFRFGVRNGAIFIDETWNEFAKKRRSTR